MPPIHEIWYRIIFKYKTVLQGAAMTNSNPPSPPPQQLQVQFDEKIADGEYANWGNIVFNPAEFIFDFGRLMPAKPSVRVHNRIILSPMHAKRLSEVLATALGQYEKQHGEIKLGEEAQKRVGF
jgi:hypothetical protein